MEPSSRSADAVARDRADMLQNYGLRDLELVKGEGSYVFDADGNRYLDCIGGIAVQALGHGFPSVVAAIKNQCEAFIHVSNLYLQGPQLELARLLKEQTGFARVFFCNSGTEANEGAIKFARKYFSALGEPERFEIVTFASSFHGRTYGALAATGQDKLKQGFGPLPQGFRTITANDATALREAVHKGTAAVLFEPILAEGGIISVTPEMGGVLRELQSRGILLIADEVQTGLCRTGPFLACEHLGLKPDLVTLAKPLGGGLPLGAVLLTQKVADAIAPGDHGTTFGGNPVACAAGAAVLRELARPGCNEERRRTGEFLRESLETLLAAHPLSVQGPLRGRGFLLGFRFIGKAAVGDSGDVSSFTALCRSRGVLIYKAGQDVVRLLPPLNITAAQIEELVAALSGALVEYECLQRIRPM